MPDQIYANPSQSRLGALPPANISVPSGAGGFSPLSVSGLVAQWDLSDASTLFTDSARTTPVAADDPIGGVTDKSGNGNHLIQATAASRPLYKVNIQNGKSVARSDVTDDLLARTFSVALSQPVTVFHLQKLTNAATAYGNSGGAGRLESFISAAKWQMFAGSTFDTLVAYDAATMVQIIDQYNGASSKFWKNGSAAATGNPGANTMDVFNLNSRNATNLGGGDTCEVLVYNAAVSVANVNLIGQYLASKWGLTWTTAS